jgi:hypothetical protein
MINRARCLVFFVLTLTVAAADDRSQLPLPKGLLTPEGDVLWTGGRTWQLLDGKQDSTGLLTTTGMPGHKPEDMEAAALSALNAADASIALYPAGFPWLRPFDALLEILQTRQALTDLAKVETLDEETAMQFAPLVAGANKASALQALLQEALVYKQTTQPNTAVYTAAPRSLTLGAARYSVILQVFEDARCRPSPAQKPTIEVGTVGEADGEWLMLVLLSTSNFDTLVASQRAWLVEQFRDASPSKSVRGSSTCRVFLHPLTEHAHPVVAALADSFIAELDALAKEERTWEVGVVLSDAQLRELGELAAVEVASLHELLRLDRFIAESSSQVSAEARAKKRADGYANFRATLADVLKNTANAPVFKTARRVMDGVMKAL